jgi:hypothetical protein
VNGSTGAIAQLGAVKATLAGVTAKYSVVVNANGHMAGFELISGGTTPTTFAVEADSFVVASSTHPDATPFVLQYDATANVMAIPAVFIGTASITNAKIANLAVDNSNVVTGAITAAGSAAIGAHTGDGTWQQLGLMNITVKSDATICINASFNQQYPSGVVNTQYYAQLYYPDGGSNQGATTGTGLTFSSSNTATWSVYVGPGTYTAVVWWKGDTSGVYVGGGTMTTIALQK